jgi:hypothetical protein
MEYIYQNYQTLCTWPPDNCWPRILQPPNLVSPPTVPCMARLKVTNTHHVEIEEVADGLAIAPPSEAVIAAPVAGAGRDTFLESYPVFFPSTTFSNDVPPSVENLVQPGRTLVRTSIGSGNSPTLSYCAPCPSMWLPTLITIFPYGVSWSRQGRWLR